MMAGELQAVNLMVRKRWAVYRAVTGGLTEKRALGIRPGGGLILCISFHCEDGSRL